MQSLIWTYWLILVFLNIGVDGSRHRAIGRPLPFPSPIFRPQVNPEVEPELEPEISISAGPAVQVSVNPTENYPGQDDMLEDEEYKSQLAFHTEIETQKSPVLAAVLSVLGVLILGAIILAAVCIIRRKRRNAESTVETGNKLYPEIGKSDDGKQTAEADTTPPKEPTAPPANIYSSLPEISSVKNIHYSTVSKQPTAGPEDGTLVRKGPPEIDPEMYDNPGYVSVEDAKREL